jgi:hypothetical protein
MSLLEPLGLLALALAPIVLLLHLLRGSRQRRVVPSVALWRGAGQQVTARAPWRRLPPSVLLVLQLAFVLVGALALARPALPAPPAMHLILVLDASASMQSLDPGQARTRFDLARERAASLLESVTDVTLIRASAEPEVLVSGREGARLQNALASATPDTAVGNMRTALLLAEHVADLHPHAANTVVVISDGAFPPLDGVDLGDLPVRFASVGTGSENQAVSGVSARHSTLGGHALEGFARVVNYADHSVEVSIDAAADGVPLAARRVSLGARSQVEQSYTLPPSTRRFGVRLVPGDALPLDDAAETSVEGATRLEAVLVSAHPLPLEPALRALPGVDVRVVAPEAYAAAPPADAVVFDEFLPPSLPATPVLIVDPPPGSPLLGVAGQSEAVDATDLDHASPLLRGVDLAAARFGGPRVESLPGWAHATAAAGPSQIVFSGQVNGQPVVVLAFDPRQAGLDRAAAFPLLVANAMAWATHPPQLEPQAIDVTPREHPELNRAGSPPASAGVPRELWPVLVILTLAVCAGEWWYDARRG